MTAICPDAVLLSIGCLSNVCCGCCLLSADDDFIQRHLLSYRNSPIILRRKKDTGHRTPLSLLLNYTAERRAWIALNSHGTCKLLCHNCRYPVPQCSRTCRLVTNPTCFIWTQEADFSQIRRHQTRSSQTRYQLTRQEEEGEERVSELELLPTTALGDPTREAP